jgi:hypothetical protein
VFLLAGDMEDQAAAEIRVVEAAKRAGVKRLVKQSVLAAESEAYSFARIHRGVRARASFLPCGTQFRAIAGDEHQEQWPEVVCLVPELRAREQDIAATKNLYLLLAHRSVRQVDKSLPTQLLC